MDGILLFNKPILWTSHDAVDFIRKKIRQKSVGHAGTLDPLATGLLVLLIGKATKLSSALISMDKDYSGSMTLGFSTDTQDLEGRVFSEGSSVFPDEDRAHSVFAELMGNRLQTPPAYSAVRQKGRKMYELARRGAVIEHQPREVVISQFTLTRWDPPDIYFFLTCSKGAYVRSLCDEAGKKLGCGATLSALVRNRVGPFRLAHALTRDEAQRLPCDLLERMLLNFDPANHETLSRN